jgi:diguanylate cyclase (GGDEF)-like protein
VRTSFRRKLLLLSIVPLAVAQIVTLFAVMRTLEADVDRQATQALEIGGTVVNEFLASRGDQLRTSVQVLAADFGLKEAVASGDAQTIVSVLGNHSQRIGADIALLLDTNGNGIASTGDIVPDNRDTPIQLIENEIGSVPQQSTIILGGHAYQTFTVALRAPVTIGWVVMGFKIDTDLAERIESLTGLKVSLTSTSGVVPHVIVSTATDGLSEEFSTSILSHGVPLEQIHTVSTGGADWLTLKTPFANKNSDVVVVLQRSLAEAMAPYVAARRGLIAFTIPLLALVALAVGWVSGSVVKPLRTLTDASRRMISGRYDEVVQVSATDEIGELASSFNTMQTAIAEREQRISHQALHDPLTDLPNHSNILQRLSEALEQAKTTGTDLAVISIGLSRMNAISSTLGHSASHKVIVLAAKHLPLDPGHILGHVGTSEFVLILPATNAEDALNYADRIANILSTGVTLGRANISLQSEIGVAGFPQHATNAADLLRRASIARSEAEAQHQAIVTYENGREDYYVRQLRIVNDLRGALQRDELQVHFQPKVSLLSGMPCGAEALVRWEHPELGWLPPDDFIPAAEQAGSIVHLTRYVLARAVKQCRIWQDKGYELQISVNLAARDLLDEQLSHTVTHVLKEYEIPARRLTLEITENSVMQEVDRAIGVLERLHDIGVRISMDDFGTGYSSLAQLKHMPLDELKIDKSFVMTMMNDPHNEAIVRTTLELAHNMNLQVVAEGVEDEATIRYLAARGCEQAQGYFLSKAISSNDLVQWLESWKKQSYAERRGANRTFQKTA